MSFPRTGARAVTETAAGDRLWYKDAIIYELHVRAFFDSNADGIGDFRGLREKLDYLQDLGVTALWLLPFYPSPLKDDGYDIAEYTNVHPSYGTIGDFKAFLKEAHGRGLRVITELVLNHTSDRCPWFQTARRSPPGSSERDFYVWSETAERYREARVIFKDFESSNWAWDPVASAYYWHRFYSHQPDLNFESPAVRAALRGVVDFWLGMGVDGLRLDAVPYLHEREGTICENLEETHRYLRELRSHVDSKFVGRMLLAEANQWPEDAVAYMGKGDECHMAFHFPLMPRLFMALRQENRFPIIDILEQTPPIPETCQWATFLRNHDELTLEMVTDEERDYMYKVYAQEPQARINLGIRRRLAPLLGNDRRLIELLNGLLFSLGGTPVLYYGDEIGMGDNIYLGDRNGVRTPLQWSADRNAGFSRANPQRLYLPIIIDPEYHYEAINIQAQENNTASLLWWMKRLISLRKRYPAFGRGTLEFLHPANRKVLAFLRCTEEECLLVVANLSRFAEYVEIDLARFKGSRPLELFGGIEFPPIGDAPYFLSLSPHAFLWFALEGNRGVEPIPLKEKKPATIVVKSPAGAELEALLSGPAAESLEPHLVEYVQRRRWFGGKARRIGSLRIEDAVRLRAGRQAPWLAILGISYTNGDFERYLLPLVCAPPRGDDSALAASRICNIEVEGGAIAAQLEEAAADPGVATALLDCMLQRRRLRGESVEISGFPLQGRRGREAPEHPEPGVVNAEQSNTSVVFGDRYILKLFRKVEDGDNPDLEVGRFLTRKRFPNVPAVEGWIEARTGERTFTASILQSLVPNATDGWKFTLDALGRFFNRVLTRPEDPPPPRPIRELLEEPLPTWAAEVFGAYPANAALLGTRTAELHAVLGSEAGDEAFAPEPFTPFAQRSFYQSLRNLTHHVLELLERKVEELDGETESDARRVLASKDGLIRKFRSLLDGRLSSLRIRCHGDFHLGQVLFTGKDFAFIDFEGEPARPLGERRLKRSPLRDVAGMLRSFHYVAYAALRDGVARPEDKPRLEPWARAWQERIAAVFLGAYLEAASGPVFAWSPAELHLLLEAHLLEKAVYEIGYELENRPDWLRIPLQGLLQLEMDAFPDAPREDRPSP